MKSSPTTASMPCRPDHTKIFQPVKPSAAKPNYGLHKKPSSWYLLHKDKDGLSRMMWLNTNDEMDARRMRNSLYAAAAANGRGPKTHLRRKCEGILEDKTNNDGILYTVQIGSTRVNCKTWEEAKKTQWEIARKIVKEPKP